MYTYIHWFSLGGPGVVDRIQCYLWEQYHKSLFAYHFNLELSQSAMQVFDLEDIITFRSFILESHCLVAFHPAANVLMGIA